MQFCSDCGAILNLFEFPDRELCSSCFYTQKDAERHEATNKPQPPCTCTTLPEGSRVFCQDGKINIVSQEGWNLWCGLLSNSYDLDNILQKVGRIYAIRKNRQQNK